MPLKPIAVESVNRICALVVGPSGIGKTSLIRTIMNADSSPPCCVVSAEAGLLSVRELILEKRVTGFEVESLEDFQDVYTYLISAEGKKQFGGGWVFIDSLTEISDRCNKYFKSKYPQKEKTYDRWDDYQLLMTTLIKAFRDAKDYNVVCTCLPVVEKDENNRRFIGPNVVGNALRQILTSFFDEVFYMTNIQGDDGQEYRTFITGPFERYPGKDRSGKLNLFEPPNLSHVYQKIIGE